MMIAKTRKSFNPWYVGGGVKRFSVSHKGIFSMCFNPWYVGGGVKREEVQAYLDSINVSILGMLEGVLKVIVSCLPLFSFSGFNPWYVGGGVKRLAGWASSFPRLLVSILGMLEGVLKVIGEYPAKDKKSFNPWYVGGGVKSVCQPRFDVPLRRFNPWYVGGGVKSSNWWR